MVEKTLSAPSLTFHRASFFICIYIYVCVCVCMIYVPIYHKQRSSGVLYKFCSSQQLRIIKNVMDCSVVTRVIFPANKMLILLLLSLTAVLNFFEALPNDKTMSPFFFTFFFHDWIYRSICFFFIKHNVCKKHIQSRIQCEPCRTFYTGVFLDRKTTFVS